MTLSTLLHFITRGINKKSMYSDNNDDDDYDTIFVMMMTMMKVTMMIK